MTGHSEVVVTFRKMAKIAEVFQMMTDFTVLLFLFPSVDFILRDFDGEYRVKMNSETVSTRNSLQYDLEVHWVLFCTYQ